MKSLVSLLKLFRLGSCFEYHKSNNYSLKSLVSLLKTTFCELFRNDFAKKSFFHDFCMKFWYFYRGCKLFMIFSHKWKNNVLRTKTDWFFAKKSIRNRFFCSLRPLKSKSLKKWKHVLRTKTSWKNRSNTFFSSHFEKNRDFWSNAFDNLTFKWISWPLGTSQDQNNFRASFGRGRY